ncbi:hypothetical protein Golob_017860, partial [Gossypium lobatum]|nr:hypothetical protein [Gossypium lobatum]
AVKETGHKFRETILALGGGKAPSEVFVEFRGREPSPEALLRHNGLLPNPETPSVFPTMLMMQPVPDPKEGYIPDDRFDAWIDSMDHNGSKSDKKKSKRKPSQSEYYKRNMKGESSIGPLREDNGKPTKISAAEAALNWQIENAIAQNRVLKKLDSKVFHLDSKVLTVEAKLDDNSKMVKDLIALLQKHVKEVAREMAALGQDFFSHITQRDKEIRRLKDQIKTLKEAGQIPLPETRPRDFDTEFLLFSSIRQNSSPSDRAFIKFPTVPEKKTPNSSDSSSEYESGENLKRIAQAQPKVEVISDDEPMADTQFLVLQDLSTPIRIIQHFVGYPDDLLNLKRQDNLKPAIFASIPDPLQVAVNQAFQRQNKDILSLTVGEIQQEIFIALEDICNKRRIFKDYLYGDKRIDKACDDSYLKFKCPKDRSCAQETQHQSVIAKDTVLVPQVLVKIYLDKYSKPITVIAFLDTGAVATIMNLDVLPSEWWIPHTAFFNSATNYPFTTYLKNKPITIQFFPRCFVKTTILGSKLPGKDIVIEGKYSSRPHIAEKLIEFPDADLTKKQIQQFLRIPYDGKRILQIDASDKDWGAILFEELERKRHICGFKNGRFTNAELHYHSTLKEILAVKKDLLTRPTKEVMALRTSQPRPIMMYRPVALSSSKNSVQAFLIPPNLNPEFPSELGSFPTAWIHIIYSDEVTHFDNEYINLQKYVCQFNRVIPFEIWPPPHINAPWDTVLDGPYYQQLLQALKEYKDDIPDPTELS